MRVLFNFSRNSLSGNFKKKKSLGSYGTSCFSYIVVGPMLSRDLNMCGGSKAVDGV